MLRGLAAQPFCGSVALEYVWIDWQQCNRTDNISETLLLRKQLERYLEGVLDHPFIAKENGRV